LREIVDIILEANVGAFSVEAGNVRHELDYRVWEDVEIPENLVLIPGVVSHATNLVEPPELVAERIIRYAEIVGREHVIAGTDCGLGGRVHPELVWAKLRTLSEGASLASERLWSRNPARA
jgi:5-methyltetrahydropteroyltriglutamate--homocysteine methyltransferase